jgi:hypothetical protein
LAMNIPVSPAMYGESTPPLMLNPRPEKRGRKQWVRKEPNYVIVIWGSSIKWHVVQNDEVIIWHNYLLYHYWHQERSLELLVPHPTCSIHVYLYSCSFNFVAPRLWNQLPFTIRSANSLSVFKSCLKTHLFTSAFT